MFASSSTTAITNSFKHKIKTITPLVQINIHFRPFTATGNSGDIRGAGGSFGKKEKAQEEQYFRQKEKEELAEFKKKQEQTAKKETQEKEKKSSNPDSSSTSNHKQ